jgi:NADH-quinone oxidoreductase subunit F
MMGFEKIQEQSLADWNELQRSPRPRIFVGAATCGRAAGALTVLERIKEELGYNVDAILMQVGCIGLCYAEPLVDIIKPPRPRICYRNVTPEVASRLICDYIVNDEPCSDLAFGTIGDKGVEGIPKLFELPVLRSQVRVVLRNCGYIDPENINHYIANGGYSGLIRALRMKQEGVIEEVKKSGLRGRGGAGFPTGKKWELCYRAPGSEKYIICNADEGDPGAFMNRSLLEGDPHSVLEGMLIGAYAIGATQGYIYCRAEYPLALERLKIAVDQMEKYGLLGDDILCSDFNFHLEIEEGAGAFVCGEETALMASIEGKRGMPRSRPPFPAISGLWGKPTNINNVETWGNVSFIMQKGWKQFAKYGTKGSKGTKTFALAGKVERTGLVEVPFGITMREIIYQIGGGILKGKKFKAAQTGGPSGGCLPANFLDTPVDYESLTAAGSIMGSGGMIVMDESTCMVDVAHYFLTFTQKESCGKCVLCREGTKQMLGILEDITRGKGKPEDINLLQELSGAVKIGSLCGLGQTAPNPVLTTLQYFRDEYEAHVNEKRCPAKVCKELTTFYILPDKCEGCGICLRACPVNAIKGDKRMIHVIEQDKCVKCGTCYDVCPTKFSAVAKVSGERLKTPEEPIPVGGGKGT